MKRKQLKYRNRRCRCKQEHVHDSALEAGHCNIIALMKRAGEIKDYQTQKKFEMRMNGMLICSHYPDFLITANDDTQYVIETKGVETDLWRIKKKLFQVCYPDIPYTVWRR